MTDSHKGNGCSPYPGYKAAISISTLSASIYRKRHEYPALGAVIKDDDLEAVMRYYVS